MHFSAFLPVFFLGRKKILCFFLLLLSFKTNLEAYPLLLSFLLDVLFLLFSLQPQIILSRAPSPFFSPLTQKKHGLTMSLYFISLIYRFPLLLAFSIHAKKPKFFFVLDHIFIRIVFLLLSLKTLIERERKLLMISFFV